LDKTLDMPGNTPLAPLSHRAMWIVWTFMLTGALLFVFLGTIFGDSTRDHMEAKDWVTVAMAIYSMWAAYWFRTKWSKRQAIRQKVTPERRWSTIQLISFSCAESVVVWGVFAKMALGSPSWVPQTLYLVGILLLLGFAPWKEPEVI
jgi:hypothetical protein